MNIMKHEGYKFPTFKESDAMFMADVAPVWKEGNRCHRCRIEFTVTLRRVSFSIFKVLMYQSKS